MIRLAALLLVGMLGIPGVVTASTGGGARNSVQRIEVSSDAASVLVTIVMRSPPTFTTRVMGARRTFVIDLPEARFERFSPITRVANGVLDRVESSIVSREGIPAARIALVLSGDGEPPLIDADGALLRVRIPGVVRPPLLAKAPESTSPPEPVTAKPQPELAMAQVPEAPPPPAPVVAVIATPEPPPPAPPAPVAAIPEPASPAPVAPVVVIEPPAPARAPQPVVARAPEPQRPAAVAPPTPPPPASASPKQGLERVSAGKTRSVPEPRRKLREVMFRPLAQSSAIVLRLSGPPSFEVVDVDERRVWIGLPDTRIERRNDTRPLDTSFFRGAVSSIVSRPAGAGTRVEIVLKQRAAHRERVEGDTLVIEFEHPAVP